MSWTAATWTSPGCIACISPVPSRDPCQEGDGCAARVLDPRGPQHRLDLRSARDARRLLPVRNLPEHLRRIKFKDPESGKTLVFLTNNTALPALTICALYKSRWQVELFFNGSSSTFGSSIFWAPARTP